MSAVYLTDVELLCTECRHPIRARINTQQWIRVEWISPDGECQACYQKAKDARGNARVSPEAKLVRDEF